MTAKPKERLDSATSTAPGESGVTHSGDTLVAPADVPRPQITGDELMAPTLHASPGGAPAELLPGTILDGVYRVEKEIGRGAMGTVYLVEHLRLGRKFAAKVVSTRHSENSEVGSRLRNEARVASRVQHENIVDVTHLGQTQSGALFIVMELLSGASLRERMQAQVASGGPRWLPDAEIRSIVADVMAGLAAAHAAGIVHRDLKPDNVFVVEKAGRRRAKIVDFGISRSSESADLGLTRDGQIIGTPLYMAPEQARGGPSVDARADLYSLGVVCHELLTGALPFQATSVYDMIVKHATEPPPPLREARPDLPEALERVLLRALAKKADERFQTVEEMRDAWDAAWGGPAPRSIPPTSVPPPAISPPASIAPPAEPVVATPVATPSVARPASSTGFVGIGALVVIVVAIAAVLVLRANVQEEAPPPASRVEVPPVHEPEREPPPVVTTETTIEATTPEAPPEAPPSIATRLVRSEPTGATVTIDGREVGTTPFAIEIGESPIEVELRLRGYRRESITVTGGSSEPVVVTLRRAREAAPELAPR